MLGLAEAVGDNCNFLGSSGGEEMFMEMVDCAAETWNAKTAVACGAGHAEVNGYLPFLKLTIF